MNLIMIQRSQGVGQDGSEAYVLWSARGLMLLLERVGGILCQDPFHSQGVGAISFSQETIIIGTNMLG